MKHPSILILAIAIVMYAFTAFIPAFVEVPRFIYSNIGGALLIAVFFGPFWGMLFASFFCILLNLITHGSSVLPYVLITSVCEAGLAGWVNQKKTFTLVRSCLTAFLLTLLIKPITLLAYFGFNTNTPFDPLLIIKQLSTYYKTGMVNTLSFYLFSCFFVYATIKLSLFFKVKINLRGNL